MSAKPKRYFLSTKESRKLVDSLLKKYPELAPLFPKRKESLQAVEYTTGKGPERVLLLGGKPVLVQKATGEVIPFIGAVRTEGLRLKTVVVDSGAVRFILNGADVMGPGIVEADEDIEEGDLVVVLEERYRAPIAVGIALRPFAEIRERGKSVKNLHHAADRATALMRELLGA
ncbi:MAG TPA: RNA-binding protein [Candidatus Korarchaeota archaeon]|nr:RNA-binding protein [Candidatus Korarchaeota archaeon]